MGTDIREIFKKVQSDVKKSDLIPLTVLETLEGRTLKEEYRSVLPSLKVARTAAEHLGCTLGDLYFVKGGFYPFCYYKDYLYIDLLTLELEVLLFTRVKEQVQVRSARIKEYLEKKDYRTFFMVSLEKKIAFSVYKEMYEEIPDEDKYEIFIDLYTRSEYGFNLFGKNFLDELKNYRSSEYVATVQERIQPYVREGYLTIYRGEGTESTPYHQAFSWTTDLMVARFFATRYGRGRIYKTKVRPEDVVDFLEGRGESEILISPNSLGQVEQVKFKTVNQILREFKSSGYMERFTIYSNRFDREWFHNPDGVHGIRHCRRVLFLCLYLAKELGLSLEEERILVNAALYHDIGRVHDDEDEQHGFMGYAKMTSLNLGRMDDRYEQEVLCYIIENHCLDDEKAVANIDNYEIQDREQAIKLLRVFKDADGLDRVRLKDLNISYLRYDISKQSKTLAQELLKYIK